MAKLRKLDEIKRLGIEFRDNSGNAAGYLSFREALEIINEIDSNGKRADNLRMYEIFFVMRDLSEPRNINFRTGIGYIEEERLRELGMI